MTKNIEFDDVIDENVLSATSSHETIIKAALEQYAEKRFGETNEKSIEYKNSLEDIDFLQKNTMALIDISNFLYSACYSKDNEYDKNLKLFISKINKEDNEIAEMKTFLLKNHENISDISLLNDLGVSKYFKRIDGVLLKLKKHIAKL